MWRLRYEAKKRRTGMDSADSSVAATPDQSACETMIKHFGLNEDFGLRELAEIVHDIDLKDNKFNRSEAAGLEAVIRGLAESFKDDRKLAQQSGPIFDGLYELQSRGRRTTGKEKDGGKQARHSTGRRRKRSARK